MHKRFKIVFIIGSAIAMFLSVRSNAQLNDVGFWTGATIQKQFTRNLEGSFTEQLRLNHDVTTINLLLTEAGVEYAISKKLKAGIHYRFINSNQDNYYSKRHRFYADVAYKVRINAITITLRERIQEQFSNYYSSETGKIPVWVLRSKLTRIAQ